MEVQRTPVDNTPLVVNLLRLIRDARSPNYKDHEKGPVTFHFGGLCMRDTGGYEDAEAMWRWASDDHRRNHSNTSLDSDSDSGHSAAFRGPLHLAVYLNHAPVEVWTLKDFRDPSTEHSVPRDFEQLEQLNTLVRVLFAHLRSQEIYGVVLQSCVTSADDGSVTQMDVFDGRPAASSTSTAAPSAHAPFDAGAASSPLSPMARETTATSIRGPHSPLNHVSLRLFASNEDCPSIPPPAQKRFLWSSEDFVRVDVVVNKAWRYQTAPPASAFPVSTSAIPINATAANENKATTTTVVGGQERSSPIKANNSPASRTQTGDSDAASHSTSPEVTGSLAKSSLPTPHLAPTGTSPSSVNRPAGVSPTSRISPLFTNQRRSPMPALSDFVLPPPELSELFGNDAARQSRSSPLGPHHPSIFDSVVGRSSVLPAPVPLTAVTAAVGHLEDVMWLCDAAHVRRMGTLVTAGRDGGAGGTSSGASSPLGAKRKSSAQQNGGGVGGLSSFAPAPPHLGSLLATASVGALSGLDLDSPLGWSGAELEDFADDDGDFGLGVREKRLHDPLTGSQAASNDTTGQLMSLLGLCSSVKLHHVAPAPFGDLVIALNLKDSSA